MKTKINLLRLVFTTIVVFSLSVGLASAQSSGTGYYDGDDIIRDIAPNTLNIALDDPGTAVTVHTTIPFSQVAGATVELDGIPIKTYFADNRGFFVAKFEIGEVRKLEDLGVYGVYDLTLKGRYSEESGGGDFEGTHPITIINMLPKVLK